MVSGEKSFLVKEAQKIIRNYMKDCKEEAALRREKYIREERSFSRNISSSAPTVLLILASAILAIYILIKIFN